MSRRKVCTVPQISLPDIHIQHISGGKKKTKLCGSCGCSEEWIWRGFQESIDHCLGMPWREMFACPEGESVQLEIQKKKKNRSVA